MKTLRFILPIAGLGLVSLIVFFIAKNNDKKIPEIIETELIQPPIPELTPQFLEKEFNVEKGVVWNFPNSTQIRIPANALMDKDSNDLKGKAILKFRDYHNAVDIFLSGIPMDYSDSTGLAGTMETAGMFELRVEVDGKEAFLKEGQKAKIELASQVADKGYNSYFLDEEAKKWT